LAGETKEIHGGSEGTQGQEHGGQQTCRGFRAAIDLMATAIFEPFDRVFVSTAHHGPNAAVVDDSFNN
jgi:hypothetical protein